MYEFPDKVIDNQQLSDEARAAGVFAYGSGRKFRRYDEETGRWEPTPPYVFVRTDPLSRAQLAILKGVVDQHVPKARPSEPGEVRVQRIKELAAETAPTIEQITELAQLVAKQLVG